MVTTRDFIKQHEGLRLEAYRCPAGKWTIGWGHTDTAKPGMRIPKEVAEYLLYADILDAYDVLDKYVAVPTTAGQRVALTSFIFNFGEKKFTSSTLLKKLNAGDYAGAANEFTRWVHAINPKTQVLEKLPGLIKRREQERLLFVGDADEKTIAPIPA